MKCSREDKSAHRPLKSRKSEELWLRQQRQHLLALYITALNYLRQLEGLLTEGTSPTGYASPLTPLGREAARAILAPVREAVQLFRDFVERYAPGELSTYEKRQPVENTLVWAANLVERIRQLSDELEPRRLARYGTQEKIARQAEKLRGEIAKHLKRAQDTVEEIEKAEGKRLQIED